MLYTEYQLQVACNHSLSHLFSLMVGLPHFDVCNQVPPGAGIQHVRHCDHQVIERSPLGLFSCTQLIPEEFKVTLIVQFFKKNEIRLMVFLQEAVDQLTSSPSGQLLISSP